MQKLKNKIFSVFTYNLWLKLIALVLAFIIWFYVNGEITPYITF